MKGRIKHNEKYERINERNGIFNFTICIFHPNRRTKKKRKKECKLPYNWPQHHCLLASFLPIQHALYCENYSPFLSSPFVIRQKKSKIICKVHLECLFKCNTKWRREKNRIRLHNKGTSKLKRKQAQRNDCFFSYSTNKKNEVDQVIKIKRANDIKFE